MRYFDDEARMLYESPHLRVHADDGIVTLWMSFPGVPVNALTMPRLRELEAALTAALADPHVEILVLRSGLPGGFCEGHDPDALANLIDDEAVQAEFARLGQHIVTRLRTADAVTTAFLEGPCVGAGLELALACDYRLAVAGPDSRIGTAPLACWNPDIERWQKAATLTAREAHRAGLVDDAFCERRAKIELRTFLDRQQYRPRKRHRAFDSREPFAEQRQRFRDAMCTPAVIDAIQSDCDEIAWRRSLPSVDLPDQIGVFGAEAESVRVAVEASIRGRTVIALDPDSDALDVAFAEALRRGRVTPLEAETARKRIVHESQPDAILRCDWIASSSPMAAFLRPRPVPASLLAAWRLRLGLPVERTASTLVTATRAAA